MLVLKTGLVLPAKTGVVGGGFVSIGKKFVSTIAAEAPDADTDEAAAYGAPGG